jgi:hypothetical protein
VHLPAAALPVDGIDQLAAEAEDLLGVAVHRPSDVGEDQLPPHLGEELLAEVVLERVDLDRRELRGVLAHEIAHIKNRDILLSSLAAAGASLITWIANALSFGALLGGSSSRDDEGASPAGGLLVALVAPLAATLIQLGISRSREYMADATGAELSGDPEALASALIRLQQAAESIPAAEGATPATASLFIVNPFGGVEGLSHWFSTHPSTAERVRRLLELARTWPVAVPGSGRARGGCAAQVASDAPSPTGLPGVTLALDPIADRRRTT